jgi:hypothetical protein
VPVLATDMIGGEAVDPGWRAWIDTATAELRRRSVFA